MGRFIKPELVRLSLSDHDFIDVKKRLNTGEYHDLFARLSPYVTPGETTKFDTRIAGTAKVLSYLAAWSFTDDGQPVPYSLDMSESARQATINNLDPDTFREIREAIEAHEEAIEAEVQKKKGNLSGPIESNQTSPSPNDSAGVTSGSVN